ncbi:27959_t:CDS:2 [Dentiscutata erythropus]|uniref:27959_t:CDS:1 n=1 Tax=Dentiscutata erythropus TaxID=1348616 RepID=A0A9N9EKA0_9GLOM|nr:27959_t:CDS:2 [Dentiscutata erythropus]
MDLDKLKRCMEKYNIFLDFDIANDIEQIQYLGSRALYSHRHPFERGILDTFLKARYNARAPTIKSMTLEKHPRFMIINDIDAKYAFRPQLYKQFAHEYCEDENLSCIRLWISAKNQIKLLKQQGFDLQDPNKTKLKRWNKLAFWVFLQENKLPSFYQVMAIRMDIKTVFPNKYLTYWNKFLKEPQNTDYSAKVMGDFMNVHYQGR